MVGLLLGLLLVVQSPDSVDGDITVLNDSLKNKTSGEILLTNVNGWKYHPGDDTSWANPEFRDSNWHTLNSFQDVPDTLWNGIGWWRLTFRVDSSLSKEALGVLLDSYGAAELYLNGKLVSAHGRPALYPENQQFAVPNTKIDHLLNVVPGKTYTLAVRYSFHNQDWYYKVSGAVTSISNDLSITIRLLDTSRVNNHTFINKFGGSLLSLAAVVLLMVMLLHLFMYYRFRRNEANLWIFLISFCLWFYTTSILLIQYFGVFTESVLFLYTVSISNLAIVFAVCLIPYVLSKVFQISTHAVWKYYVWFAVVYMAIRIIFSDYFSVTAIHGWSLVMVCAVPLLAGLVITYRAYQQEVKDIWPVAGALLGFPVFSIISIVLILLTDTQSPVLRTIIYFLYLTILPVGFSIYQVKKFFGLHENMDRKVKERTSELEEAYRQLQNSLEELQNTQDQLVQQEKLASLGQLTAGIAHEIKNPLNFVNNFSDLSVELVEEVREELQSETADGKRETVEEALAILDDVEANLKKINEHGSRADGIVKSMLQHSRGGDGEVVPTDLNALVEEYVNLAFHGMRASEDPINVDIEMDLDDDVGEVPLIAEDFSRVIINLCNNAFDAMKKKQEAGDYVPKLMVRTYQNDANVTIEIEDNGPGIPEDVRDKIMQPFFTTKEGTEGTGLGLSITNDIVKAHGGELGIESTEEGSVFRIQLNNK